MQDDEQTMSADEMDRVVEVLMQNYGRSGSGRASALRLLGAYMVYRKAGYAGLRKFGFSRDSILLYVQKLRDAGLFGS